MKTTTGKKTSLLLCYPANDAQVEQIRAIVPEWAIQLATQENVANLLPACDVFCGHARGHVDWETVVKAGRLQWIQSSAAGLDWCLKPAVLATDIVVSSASGLFRDSVAEQAMALLYGLVRSLPAFFRAQQKHDFTRLPTCDLHGSSVGIAGFGGNGQRIAELLRPVASQLMATDAMDDLWRKTPAVTKVDRLLPANGLAEMLRQSNVVIATLPLTQLTRNIFCRETFGLMPKGSWFVNVGRGGLVNETDLIRALDSGQLAGAGLDVTATEPLPEESPLWDHPSVIITPHVGAQSGRRYQLVTDFFCRNLPKYLAGQRLYNIVDKQQGIPLPADRVY
jgi:phosphoglycerate dehydrogenase-like enzyme